MAYPLIYREHAPDIRLKDFIKCYWEFYQEYPDVRTQTVDPDSSYELILIQKGTVNFGGVQLPSQFIVGQLDKQAIFGTSVTLKFVGIRFLPWGLDRFGRINAITKHDATFAADQIFESELLLALQEIKIITDPVTICATLNQIFLHYIDRTNSTLRITSNVGWALQHADSRLRISELAEHYHISPRQLHRNLKKSTGLSPQEIAIRLRFEKARDMLMHNPDMVIADVLVACGYIDQSHLTKEFKRFIDITPTKHAEKYRQFIDRMSDTEHVSFLQSKD